MQLNEHWSHNVAVNVLINGLIDSKMLIDLKIKNYQKKFLNLIKRLSHFKCNEMTTEAFISQLTTLLTC